MDGATSPGDPHRARGIDILTSGPETIRNEKEAERWYARSAQAGCPQGSLGFGLALLRRAQDQRTQTQAAEQIAKASAAGIPTALYLVGALREFGLGLQRDLAAAIELYRQAAIKGMRLAQRRLGVALINGQGVELNLVEGETWLRRAAVAGDAEAAARVGLLYARGGGLPPNYVEAATWLNALQREVTPPRRGPWDSFTPQVPASAATPTSHAFGWSVQPSLATKHQELTLQTSYSAAAVRLRIGPRRVTGSNAPPRPATSLPPSTSPSALPKALGSAR